MSVWVRPVSRVLQELKGGSDVILSEALAAGGGAVR